MFENLMSGGKKLSLLQGGVDSVVGENAKFKGEMITKGSINVNGEFEGLIQAKGEVIISAGGKVVGEVIGGVVVVSGKVEGNITAKETLDVTKTGRVQGDLTAGRIIIEEGSTYHGRVKVESGREEEAFLAEAISPQPESV
ncbi:MAG: polymer-forming cytoskeletal protein [bacterium]